jgi:superfamily II DNA or RNA helicase
MSSFDPYQWQTENLNKYLMSTTTGINHQQFYLLEACPGAGKTVGTGKIAKSLFDDNQIDFAIAVVPSIEPKYNFLRDWKKYLNLEITVIETEIRGPRPPSQYQGAVLTYQHLITMLDTFRIWASRGVRLHITLDEIHHLVLNRAWGDAAAQLVSLAATTSVGVTGTGFRTEGERIAFVKYSDDGKTIADHCYPYRAGVRDGIVKPVTFWTENGGIIIDDVFQSELKISDAATDQEIHDLADTIFRPVWDGGWLQTVIERCHDDLQRDRLYRDPSAGLLLVARPGTDDADEERHVRLLATFASRVFGESIPSVFHDDKDAVALIERFRHSQTPAIAAINMISEGVDIRRLSHLIMARYTGSELFFRQLIGRIIRASNPQEPGEAKAYIPAFPRLLQFAARMEEEAVAGLRERTETLQDISNGNGTGNEYQDNSSSHILGSFHNPGGAVTSKGEVYSSELMEAIRILKAQDPDAAKVPDALMAKMWSYRPEDIVSPTVKPEDAEEPLETKKLRQRRRISELQKQFGQTLYDADPDRETRKRGSHWSKANYDLYRNLHVNDLDDLMNNYPVEKANQCIQILEDAIARQAV